MQCLSCSGGGVDEMVRIGGARGQGEGNRGHGDCGGTRCNDSRCSSSACQKWLNCSQEGRHLVVKVGDAVLEILHYVPSLASCTCSHNVWKFVKVSLVAVFHSRLTLLIFLNNSLACDTSGWSSPKYVDARLAVWRFCLFCTEEACYFLVVIRIK